MLNIFLSALKTEEERIFFTEIYNDYRQMLYGISLKYLKDKSLAEDCVNSTFVDIIKYFDAFRQVPVEYREAYLARTCKNSAYRINQDYRYDVSYDDYNEDRITEFSFMDYEKTEVIDAVNSLDNKYREPFIMKNITGLSPNEISELLGISPNLVSQRLVRARRMLRDLLTEV